MPQQPQNVPVTHSWRLNERHYGSLVGQSKQSIQRLAAKYDVTAEDVWNWRRSWDVRPPAILTAHAHAHAEACRRETAEEEKEEEMQEGDKGHLGDVHRATVITRHALAHAAASFATSIDTTNTTGTSTTTSSGSSSSSTVPFYMCPLAYSCVATEERITLPLSESLKDTADRVYPLWRSHVLPQIGMA